MKLPPQPNCHVHRIISDAFPKVQAARFFCALSMMARRSYVRKSTSLLLTLTDSQQYLIAEPFLYDCSEASILGFPVKETQQPYAAAA